jgi:hypothetical protein
MEARPLGRVMAATGVQAVKCHRGGVQALRYTFELKEKMEGPANPFRDVSCDQSMRESCHYFKHKSQKLRPKLLSCTASLSMLSAPQPNVRVS